MMRLESISLFALIVLAALILVWLGAGRRRSRTNKRDLRTLLDGHRNTALLYVAAKLGLPDLLSAGPRSSTELAQMVGAHAPSLHRVLRGLVALGVCSEESDGRFGLTKVGICLQSKTPGTLRGHAILCGEEYAGAWGGLLHSAMTGESAFKHVFGTSQWKHRKQHPELNEHFNEGMRPGAARTAAAILARYDFSKFHTVMDAGGGHGTLLAVILKAHPSMTGILFDQPHVVSEARSHLEAEGVAERCTVVGGDFFERVPEGADAHILKSVIHDWGDEESLTILRNCHNALEVGGRLVLVERILPVRVEQDRGSILGDVHMLAVTGGRERTEDEFHALLEASGFRPARVIPISTSFRIIEGVRR